MDPHRYCQQKAAASGSSFYYSFLFLPEERRRAITALYAFCREVDDVVDDCSDTATARATLGWWRTELAAAFHGNPQHPVARALAEVGRNGVPTYVLYRPGRAPLVLPELLTTERVLAALDS